MDLSSRKRTSDHLDSDLPKNKSLKLTPNSFKNPTPLPGRLSNSYHHQNLMPGSWYFDDLEAENDQTNLDFAPRLGDPSHQNSSSADQTNHPLSTSSYDAPSQLSRPTALTRGQPSSEFDSYTRNNTASDPSQNNPFSAPYRQPNVPGTSLSLTWTSKNPITKIFNNIFRKTTYYDNPRFNAWQQWAEDLADDPRKSDEEIKDLLNNIRPDMEIPMEQREGTPDALRYPLYPHQQLGLQWMKKMEDSNIKGGILADDMGLGKTISMLSLIVSRPSSNRDAKTNLIVGPVSLIQQWKCEIEKKLKANHRLSTFLLHGKKAVYDDLCQYDVVLTTYGTVAQQYNKYQGHIARHPNSDPAQDAELARKAPLLHPKSTWYRVILDEAQCIKNKDTKAAKGAHDLIATFRWCLTGTPMMNGAHELYSLVKFLLVKPYSNIKKFNEDFGCLTAAKSAKSSERQVRNQMQKLRALLKAIMLRRMKNSQIDGKPILNLPQKTEESTHVVFSADEATFYQTLENRSRIQFNKYLREGTVGKNYSNILVLLLRLRQACCHPHLNLDFEVIGGDMTSEGMMELAKSIEDNVVTRIREFDAFECPICFDVSVNPCLLLPCGHHTCFVCLQQLADSVAQSNIRDGQEDRNDAKCPQCRGNIDLKKVIDYEAFVKVYMPEKTAEMNLEVDKDLSDDRSSIDSDDEGMRSDLGPDDDVDESGNLKGFVVADEVDDSDSDGCIRNHGSREDFGLRDDGIDQEDKTETGEHGSLRGFVVPDREADDENGDSDDCPNPFGEDRSTLSKSARKLAKKDKTEKRKKPKEGKVKRKMEEVRPHMLKTLRQDAGKNKDARRRYMHYLRKNWETSAKVTMACKILEGLRNSGEKTIIFSIWTGLLDLLEIPLKYELRMKYCRYDGNMSPTQRDQIVKTFMEDGQATVMLISLKAGNAGLNLTAASQVILMDPFWNPYIEMQAVDRAHRIGQQRPIHVHRILVKDTIEDRIVDLQGRKRAIVDSALDEGESKNVARLSREELCFLFGVRGDASQKS